MENRKNVFKGENRVLTRGENVFTTYSLAFPETHHRDFFKNTRIVGTLRVAASETTDLHTKNYELRTRSSLTGP